MNKKSIRLGIIGAGSVTTNPGRHIDSIQALNDPGAELVALADVIPGFAKNVATRFGIKDGYDDYHELLARPDINAVAINTPTDTHKEIAIPMQRQKLWWR